MNISLRNLLALGVAAELAIFLTAYMLNPSIGESVRYAARYSGRLSAFVFLSSFYLFVTSFPVAVKGNVPLRNFLTLFAVLHAIHWGFLATNVYLNAIPLEAPKLAGGALAYSMIIAAPFALHKVRRPFQLIYFYYVSLVMILTYVARIKGDFEGAEPFWFHYAMVALLGVSALRFGWKIKESTAKGSEDE